MDLTNALTFNVAFGAGLGVRDEQAHTSRGLGKMGGLHAMVATITNAPEAYDYGYCIQVTEGVQYGDQTGRLVLIPAVQFDYQTGRYRSGLYFAVPIVEGGGDAFFSVRDWADTIVSKLQGRLFKQRAAE